MTDGWGRHRPWGRPLALASLVAMLLVPLLVTAHPPLQDYPNHIARLHILTDPGDPVLAQFYVPDWSLRPNLAFDLIAVGLARLMPVEVAGRVFLAIAMVVVATAPMALERALRGEIRGASLLALPLCFNLVLQKGFAGYYLGTGLAVWAYALWIAARGSLIRRAAIAHLAAAAIFLIHLYAVAIFGVLVGGHWIGERLAGRRGGGWLAEGALTGAAFVLPAIQFLATPTAGAASVTHYAALWIKLAGLASALSLTATAPALAVVALTLLPLALRLLRGQALIPREVTVPVLILAALALALPYMLLSSANADWRIVPPLALVLAGAADLGLATRAARQATAAFAAALALVASLSAAVLWAEGDRVAASFDRVTRGLAPGAKLFPVILDPTPWGPGLLTWQHVAARAVGRGVFVPSVFAIPSQQPLRFTPGVEPLRLPFGQVFHGQVPPDWDGVRRHFDCVLLIHTDPVSVGTVPDLPIPAAPVATEPRFVLYRIAETPGACGD